MEFRQFKEAVQANFASMVDGSTHLFEVDVDKDKFWELYLGSFPKGTNEFFRKRTQNDCSCCRQFIRNIGNVVAIKGGELTTLWDIELGDDKYQPVADAMAKFIRSHTVTNMYLSDFKKVGTDSNLEVLESGDTIKWEHFYLELPSQFVNRSKKSVEALKGAFRDVRNVFKRSLDELTMESVETVLELMAQKSLYKGEEFEGLVKEFYKYKKEYENLKTESEKEFYAWEMAGTAGEVVGKIRNKSIGTLLVDISDNMDLDTAVKRYGKKTDPINYKHPKTIYTKRQYDDAVKMITELGYLESLDRRFAHVDDITVDNVLFVNRDTVKRLGGIGGVLAEMEKGIETTPKKFSKVEEIPAQDFIDNVLPLAKEVEVFVDRKHTKNFVSLIAPVNPDAKSMFKWGNGLSWAYTGNITDSDIRENVKLAGGKVDGVLRFSIQWNDDGNDPSDLDAHCIEPSGNEIYYGSCRHPRISKFGGQLDVDIIDPRDYGNAVAVENIVYMSKDKMQSGQYKFFVNPYTNRGSKGFKAEIELDGEIFSFEYNKPLRSRQRVLVATVVLGKDGTFEMKEGLDGTAIQTETWGVKSNQFVPVSVICHSPNYFDKQEGIGHRHLFFMLKGCENKENPNGFYNEYLKNELMVHKRFFEVLGSKCQVANSEDQLSGIGFSMTKRADLVVKVKGSTERLLKIKF